jgi:hypothetical protein
MWCQKEIKIDLKVESHCIEFVHNVLTYHLGIDSTQTESKNYCFDVQGVPASSDYLMIKYSVSFQLL